MLFLREVYEKIRSYFKHGPGPKGGGGPGGSTASSQYSIARGSAELGRDLGNRG